MAERKPLFLSSEGYSEEMNTADSMQLGGLIMGGNIAMGTNLITGLGPGVSGTDAVNKNQLDALASGISWKEPVVVLNMISDADQGGSPPGAPVEGDAYVVNNWGGGFTDGDIVEYDGATWNVIVDEAAAGEPPDGTRVLVSATSATTPAGSFTGSDQKIGTYDATGNTWSFDTPADGWAVLIIGDGSIYEDLGYTFDGTNWVQFTGTGQIVAGDGLSKDGNTINVNPGDGIAIVSDYVAVELDASAPGLEFTGTTPNATLGVKDGNGIEVTANGVEVDLSATPGLEFATGELQVKAGDGIVRDANGVNVDLYTTNPGLQFIGATPNGELAVKYDGAHGIVTGASGIELEIDDTPDTLDVDADGLKVVGLPLQFKINDLAVKNTVTKAALDALTDGSNADAYHTHTGLAVDEAERIENIVTVNAAVALGDPVYWSTVADRVAPADAATLATTRVVGIATTAQPTPGSTTTMVSIGIAAGVLSSATPGTRYYLAAGGGLTATRPTGSGNRIIQVGYAVNSTDLWVEIQDFGRVA